MYVSLTDEIRYVVAGILFKFALDQNIANEGEAPLYLYALLCILCLCAQSISGFIIGL